MNDFLMKTVVVFLLIFATVNGNQTTNTTVRLKCYQCTSLNNTQCADPFSAFDTEQVCQPYGGVEAILCRKLKQTIDTPLGKQIRVTRSCGYLKNDDEERDQRCFKSSMTASSSSRYCACNADACNSADNFVSSAPSALLLIMSSIYALFTSNV